jgi:hypothetical protein
MGVRHKGALAFACLAAGALFTSSCSSATVTPTVVSRPTALSPTTTQAATLPTAASVAEARFLRPVELDDGSLEVEPPGPGEHPTLPGAEAAAEIWASSALLGYHQVVVGFGIATIAVFQAGVPTVTSLPAWVGFAVANLAHCPAETAPSGPTTTLPALPSSGYAAIVLGAESGSPAIAYTARSSSCGFSPTGPSVSSVGEVVSIPWVALGSVTAGQLSVRGSVPPCGTYQGSSVGGDAQSITVTLDAVVPDVPLDCPSAQSVVEAVQIGPPNSPGAPPPIVSSRTLITHGPLGPVQVVS